MSFEKKKILLKALVESQFGYRSLTWMLYSRKANSKINHIHEKSLKNSVQRHYFLLKKDKSFCIHYRNIHSLAIELFKVKNKFSHKIMCDIFETRNF